MKTKIKTYYILPVITSLVIIALIIYLIVPKATEISELNTKLTGEKASNENLTNKRKALENLRSQETELNSQSRNISIALPNQKAISSLIMTIQSIVQSAEASISSMQISPGVLVESKPRITQNADELQINISLSGTSDQIKNVTQRLYRAKRLLNLKSLTLNVSPTGVTATGIITAYYKIRPQLPANVEEVLPIITQDDNALVEELETFTNYSPEGVEN